MAPRRSLFAVLALLSCVSWQLAGAVHTATVRHVTCAEHGALVEVTGSGSGSVAAAEHACVLPADADDAHHAHCDQHATPSTKIATRSPSSMVLVAEARRVATGARAVVAPIPLLALAPKSSPPV